MATVFKLYWTNPNGQSDIPMGEFPTEEAANAAIPESLVLLLDQCGTDEDRQDIKAGSWSVSKEEVHEVSP